MARATRGSLVAAMVAAFLLGVLIWWRDEHPYITRTIVALTPASNATPRTGRGAARSVTPVGSTPAPLMETPRPYEPRPMTPEMRERRRRVLDAPAVRTPVADPAAPSEATAMKDRTGELGPEVEALNQQLIPLIGQCFAQARERGVRGRGMVALAVKLAGAEGIGRVVESVEPVSNSAILDAELIDCVRQSAFTVDLPPPTSSGSNEVLLTLPFEGAPDAGAPSWR